MPTLVINPNVPLGQQMAGGYVPSGPRAITRMIISDQLSHNQHEDKVLNMAKTPSVTSKPNSGKLGNILNAAGTALVGYTALESAQSAFPEVYEKAKSYFAASGKDIHEIAGNSMTSSQSSLLEVLGRMGFPMRTLKDSVLSAKELSVYDVVIQRYLDAQTLVVDDNQTPHQTTGEQELDRIAVNLDIQKICQKLNISSDTYADLLRGLNTHTSSDVERFQLHRKMYNLGYI
jgi:hypothetical protein